MAEVVQHLADTPDAADHPFFRTAESPQNVAVILVTADRGLAGGYNSSIVRATERRLREHQAAGRRVQLVVIGRKGESYFRYRNQPILASVTSVADRPGYEDARKVVAAVMGPFEAGELDQIELVYTRFVSLGLQRVVERQLIPLADREALEAEGSDDRRGRGEKDPARTGEAPATKTLYEFEPEPAEILDRLLPSWLEAEVLAAMLDAAASEHAARQRAMKAATDNAEELIKTLRRIMNRARQDSITTEIMEIVGGAEALRQAGRGGDAGYHDVYASAAESA
jgi:F-type H+-transporting ATPase subunit gamma